MAWMERSRALALAAMISILTPGLAAAGDKPPPDDSGEKQRHATELAIQATQMLMHALDLLIDSLPEYGPPRIEENGDIVIPRLHKTPEPEHGPATPEKTGKPAPGTPL